MSLDKSFNSPTGFIVKQFFSGNDSDGSSFAIDGNNRIVTVGTANDGTDDYLLLARYTQTGILDSQFAGGVGYVTVKINGLDTRGISVALDQNNNILIAGNVLQIVNKVATNYMFVTKYFETGTIDGTFALGTGYIIQKIFGDNYTYAKTICIDNNNNILVSGRASNSSDENMFIVRYTNSGVLDNNFASGVGYLTKRFNNSDTLANCMVVDTDDSIYITGYVNEITITDEKRSMLLAKFTDTGVIDINFGNGSGFITKQFVNGFNSDGNYLILDKDHSIYITGQVLVGLNPSDTGIFNVYVAKYSNTGDLDTEFASGKGFVYTRIGIYNSFGISLAFDKDNNILVTCQAGEGSGFTNKNFVVKYTFVGALDTNFGSGNGYIRTEPTNYSSNAATQILIDNNDRILLIGNVYDNISQYFLLERYLNIDIPPTTTMPPTTTHHEPICLPLGTPINTDQGLVAIEKLNTAVHTINRQRIVSIIRTITPEKELVCFEKHSVAINCPKERTLMTPGHCVLYKGQLIQAKHFVGRIDGVHTVPYNGKDVLYNVLMDKHSVMAVNGMVLETLHPSNKVAKKILGDL
jgi:uncharacterized delta-60 repeat protein